MDITMPQLGESMSEGTILRWFKSVGEPVAANEVLFEVATDKVDAEVPSPVAGVVTEIRVVEGATVSVGAVLAVVDGATAPAYDPTPVSPPAATTPAIAPASGTRPASETSTPATQPPASPSAAPQPAPGRAPASHGASSPASPLVRRILREAGIALDAVVGTGRLGRITRGDAERATASRQPSTADAAPPLLRPDSPDAPPAPSASSTRAPTPSPETAPPATAPGTVAPMNRIRQRTAAHMVRSRATSPHALVATEVRYDAVERVRRSHREAFRAEEGTSLTYLPFIARATIDALRRFPAVNASVTAGAGDGHAGDGLLLRSDINLAVAVDLGFEGLVAPVIHHADDYRLRALARRVGDAAQRARSGDLGPDDLAGGTFTISNSGSYGTHLVIPIINQPQVAILSTDAVRRQPVVVRSDAGEEAIGIGSVGLLALSWDQRAFDGAYASAFLDEMRTILETRDWEAELR